MPYIWLLFRSYVLWLNHVFLGWLVLVILSSLTLKHLVANIEHSCHDARSFSSAGLLGELDDVVAEDGGDEDSQGGCRE